MILIQIMSAYGGLTMANLRLFVRGRIGKNG